MIAVKKKPDLIAVAGERMPLKRSGRGFMGRCFKHDDRSASMSFSDDKGLFHCFSCGISGDVIDFVQQFVGVGFVEACKILGMDISAAPQKPVITPSRRRAAELAAAWALEQRAKFNCMIADGLEERDLADELGDSELAESFDSELIMLDGFYNSLGYSHGVVALLAVREAIEGITADAEVSL